MLISHRVSATSLVFNLVLLLTILAKIAMSSELSSQNSSSTTNNNNDNKDTAYTDNPITIVSIANNVVGTTSTINVQSDTESSNSEGGTHAAVYIIIIFAVILVVVVLVAGIGYWIYTMMKPPPTPSDLEKTTKELSEKLKSDLGEKNEPDEEKEDDSTTQPSEQREKSEKKKSERGQLIKDTKDKSESKSEADKSDEDDDEPDSVSDHSTQSSRHKKKGEYIIVGALESKSTQQDITEGEQNKKTDEQPTNPENMTSEQRELHESKLLADVCEKRKS